MVARQFSGWSPGSTLPAAVENESSTSSTLPAAAEKCRLRGGSTLPAAAKNESSAKWQYVASGC
eukprot:10049460-Karenia_brevis.AAC.1